MARRRYISTKISTDKAVNKLAMECGDFAALLYTWLIPHAEDDCTLMSDPDEILMTVMPGRRDKTTQDVKDAIKAIVSLGLLEYDYIGNLRFIPDKFYKYQTCIKLINRVDQNNDDNTITAENSAEQRETAENTASVPVPVPVPFTLPVTLPVTESTVPTKDKITKSRFKKPTLEELTAYCQERHNEVSPQRFIDHYESNGWKVGGKSAMKDWKAAVRNWEHNGYEKKQGSGGVFQEMLDERRKP